MNKLTAVTVFCGSNEGNDITIISDAIKVGETLAQQGITLIYGAAKIGIMGKVAKGALDQNGKVIGVIPEFLKKKELVHLGLHKLVSTKNMHQRKLKMHDLSDGFIALPGGLGTLEELFEILTWAQLGLHDKPIGLLNINGFYDHLIAMLEAMVLKGFLKMENLDLLLVDDNIESLLDKMRQFKPSRVPKWLNIERT